MLPKGIMFDLDDTILAYSPVAEPTWRKVCETYAEKEKGLSAESLLEAIFKSSKWYWSDPLRHTNGRLDLIKARREILAMAFDHLGIRKPEKAVYSLALDAMDMSPKDVWFVGDNLEWDVAAPQRMGIFAIWNDYRHQGLPASAATIPDRIIHSISELC